MFNFTHEPSKELCVNKGDVSDLFWRVESAESCPQNWKATVDVKYHTLSPNAISANQSTDDSPISKTSEYNLTITGPENVEDCGESGFEMSVSLSLRFTDNVLQHVHYILIEVRTSSEMSIWSRTNISIISDRSDSCSDLRVLETTTDKGSITAKVTYDNVTDVANTSTGIACCVKSNLLLILTLLLLHQTASSIFAGYICGFV